MPSEVTPDIDIVCSSDGMLALEATTHEATTGQPVPGLPEFAAACRELDHRSLGYRFLKRLFDVVFSLCVIVMGIIPGLLL